MATRAIMAPTMASGLLGQHTAFRSFLLHLIPGVPVIVGALFAFGPLTARFGLPRQLGNVVNVFVSIVVLQLGALLCLGRATNGTWGLQGVVLNREKLPAARLAVIVAVLFVWAVIVIRLLSKFDRLLFERFFYWFPASLLPERDLSAYPATVLTGTSLLSIVIIGVAAPIVEEMYFRGFLLPRVAWMGAWAPLWSAVLFNAYHFWSPWRIVSRTIFSLPTVYAVWRKRSISIGIWWHCLGNVLGELLALAAVLRVVQARG